MRNASGYNSSRLTRKPRRSLSKRNLREWGWGYLMVAPTIIGLIILNIIPMFQSLYMSLCKSCAFGRGDIFIGLDNYRKLINDAEVWRAVLNTVEYMLLVVPIGVVLSMLLAVALNRKIVGKTIYRVIYFIPMVAAPAAVTMMWRWIYNTHYGILNYVLESVGLNPESWIENPKIAIFSIAFIGIWSTVGYNMVLILAGLQEIPKEYYEASSLDGASPLRQLVSITIPMVSPTLFFVVITSIISAMQVFDVIFMMVDFANPAYQKTVSLVYLFYNNSFKYSNKGYGSAIVTLLLVIILVLTAIQNRLQKKWVYYD